MDKKIKSWTVFFTGVCLVSLLTVVLSCSTKEKTVVPKNTSQTLDNAPLKFESSEESEEESQIIAEESEDNTVDKAYDGSLGLSDDEALDIPSDLLRQIRQALLVEDYNRVLDLVENRTDDASTYYRGIAYFVMMQEDHKYSDDERAEFAYEAETLLEEVANTTSHNGLRARALLWYGVTLQANYTELAPLKKAVASLYEISRYPKSKVYNDSVYYMGNVHAKMGWYGPARYYYKKVYDLYQNDDSIYDYTDKEFYSTSEASFVGLERLEAYMSGQHKDYK